jgi:UPF0716 protein FxsA
LDCRIVIRGLPDLRFFPITFLALCFAEIAVLIWVGGRIGVFSVLLLLILALVAGAALIRSSGANAMALMRGQAWSSRQVSEQAAKGLLMGMAGLLLIVPGFLSDIAGLALLLPPVRNRVARFLERHVGVVKTGSARPYPGGGPVIEGEAIEVEPERDGPDRRPPNPP